LFPDVVFEMSGTLARRLSTRWGIPVNQVNGRFWWIHTARGKMRARALVTNRVKDLLVKVGETDRYFHQIGIFWHWGYKGIKTGHSANRLTPHVGCANTRIPEFKAFLCTIRP
jgi:formate dehydrogenase major subunit